MHKSMTRFEPLKNESDHASFVSFRRLFRYIDINYVRPILKKRLSHTVRLYENQRKLTENGETLINIKLNLYLYVTTIYETYHVHIIRHIMKMNYL